MSSRARVTDGLAAPWQGLAFVISTPGAWLPALVPMIVFVLLFAGCSALGVHFVERGVEPWLTSAHAGWTVVVVWLVRVLLWIGALIVGLLVALALAQPVSGPALEAIAKRQGRALGMAPPPDAPGGFFRSLRVTMFGLLITLPIVLALTLVGVLVPPLAVVTVPLKFVVSALMLAWDLLDYPLSLRAAGVRARLAWFAANFGAALGFGVSIAIIFLIPGAGLLFLPAGVAGATRLVVESERALPPAR